MTTLPPLFESKAGIEEVDGETVRTGAMIALRPRQDHVDRLAVEGGEKPDELHCTILFMGKGDDYSYDTRARIIDAMRDVATRNRQVTGEGWNIGLFNPNSDQACIALGVGGAEMVNIRNAIIAALQGMDLLQVPEQHEPWVPHITLNYTDDQEMALGYTDLTGEPVVFDAIRVVFSGITDDIPLQSVSTAGDGYTAGNRYAAVPPNLSKSFRTPRVEAKDRKPSVVLTRAQSLYELKVRHVRTAAGARRYGQPIGSVIVADGSALEHIKEVESDYEGYNKYNAGGRDIYTAKEGSKWVAYDSNDNVMASDSSEDGLLRGLDTIVAIGKRSGAPTKPSKSQHRYSNLVPTSSEYDGYDKYTAPDGSAVYRDTSTNRYYDENDNELSDVALRKLDSGKSAAKEPSADQSVVPAAYRGKLTAAESEYDGYEKYIGHDGSVFYIDDDATMTLDENDNVLGRSRVKNRGERRDLLFRGMLALMPNDYEPAAKKPATSRPGSTVRSTGTPRTAAPPVVSTGGGIAPRVSGTEPVKGEDPRDSMPSAVDNADELDAVLDEVVGNSNPSDEMIAELRRIAARQRDVRNRRKLTLYAQSLTEQKTFNALVDMDPFLRAMAIQYKLVTPGGRIGSDRSLGSRSNRENWVERTGTGKLPQYIRIVRNGLMKAGHSESRATALAVAAMKRWARGGDNVRPQVQAAAAKALAEWEAMKAAA